MYKFFFVCLSATEYHYHLCRKDTQEHGEWVNRRVTYGMSLLCTATVGVCQCWWIGERTSHHTHDGEVVEMELHPRERTYY